MVAAMVAAMDSCHEIAMVAAMVAVMDSCHGIAMVAAMVAAMGLLWIAAMDCCHGIAMNCCYGLLLWTGHVGLAQKSAGNVVSPIGCSNSNIS